MKLSRGDYLPEIPMRSHRGSSRSALLAVLLVLPTWAACAMASAQPTFVSPCAVADTQATRHRDWAVAFFTDAVYSQIRGHHQIPGNIPADSIVQVADSAICSGVLEVIGENHSAVGLDGPVYVFKARQYLAASFPWDAGPVPYVWLLSDSLDYIAVFQR